MLITGFEPVLSALETEASPRRKCMFDFETKSVPNCEIATQTWGLGLEPILTGLRKTGRATNYTTPI